MQKVAMSSAPAPIVTGIGEQKQSSLRGLSISFSDKNIRDMGSD